MLNLYEKLYNFLENVCEKTVASIFQWKNFKLNNLKKFGYLKKNSYICIIVKSVHKIICQRRLI